MGKTVNFTKIFSEFFIYLVEVLFETGYFLFDDKFFHQKDGTVMRNPLSPILANILMEFVVESVLKKLSFLVPLAKTYVYEGIFAVPKDRCQYVPVSFNNFHNKIKFTMECIFRRSKN